MDILHGSRVIERLVRFTTLMSIFSTARGAKIVRTEHFKTFKTEPSFLVPSITIETITDDDSLLEPGLIFLSPCGAAGFDAGHGYGPIIYDIHGNLIWLGQELTEFIPELNIRARANNLHVCDYLGERQTHLCWTDAWARDYRSIATNQVFDESYQKTTSGIVETRLWTLPNPHEFNVIRGGTSYLQAVYDVRQADLTPYGGPASGWYADGCFQEVDMVTKEEIFAWCYLHRFPFWHTRIFMNVPANTMNYTSHIAGDGTYQHPWDLLHINSVVLTSEGDYLVSIRHNDQVLKIAGPGNIHGLHPGTVIWRLGGVGSDFMFKPGTSFSRQHSAQEISVSADGSTLLLLDNAFEGDNPSTATFSSAKMIAVNNYTKEAKLIQEYGHPDKRLAKAEGSVVQLPKTGNILVGWGWTSSLSEFTKDGTLLYHARLKGDGAHSYRAYKFPWVGKPLYKPKLLAYRQSCSMGNGSRDLHAHVSWNGDTEVVKWRFYTSNTQRGPWDPAGTFDRDGFETSIRFEDDVGRRHAAPFVKAEGVDAKERVLGSVASRTWVPNESIAAACDEAGCFDFTHYTYPADESMAGLCEHTFGDVYASITSGKSPAVGGMQVLVAIAAMLTMCWVGMKVIRRRPRLAVTARDQRRWSLKNQSDMPPGRRSGGERWKFLSSY